MSKFNIGEKVICVNTRWKRSIYEGLIVPHKYKIYTIRELDSECCRLVEIINYPVSENNSGDLVSDPEGTEPKWFQWHFEKYDEVQQQNILEANRNAITEKNVESYELQNC